MADNQTNSPLLEIVSLNKGFGGVRATDNVSLDVRNGEIHAIIGPNGAGKTTLISQLSGLLKPDSRVRISRINPPTGGLMLVLRAPSRLHLFSCR